MDEARERSARYTAAALWRAVRPAAPAAIGTGALTFLFAAVIPLAWVTGISWNLYLDRLSDLFVPPVGNGGRLALALGLAAIVATIAGLIALVIAKPTGRRSGPATNRFAKRARRAAEDILPRRRADAHPDDAPRPPIRADRDLPVGGLGPVPRAPIASAPVEDEPLEDEPLDLVLTDMAADDEQDELILANLAPVEYDTDAADAPWLQPAEIVGGAKPAPVDNSLGAMVARFEAGLAQRRANAAAPSDTGDDDIGEQPVDFALEAALSTLQRMTRRAVG